MGAVVARMQDTSYVLKGGTALAFAYGLDRHSTDIDFAAAEPVYIKDRIHSGLQDAGVGMAAFIVAKDTAIGQRLKVHYTEPGTDTDRLMNVDMSFRTVPSEDDIIVVNGIRTYKVTSIFDQKLSAAKGRTVARDLYDLAFLASEYGDQLSAGQIRCAEEFTRDYDVLANEYHPAFRHDKVLGDLTTADDRALMFRIAIEEQLARRGQAVIKQAVPVGQSLAQVLAWHNIWLETDGQEGRRADLSDTEFRGAVLCGANFEKVVLSRADFTDADLRNANLRDAILHEAVFDGSDLRGVDATGADLTGVTMRKTMLGGTTKGIAEALVKESKRHAISRAYRPKADSPRDIEPDIQFAR